MKKLFFLFLATLAITLISCVDVNDPEEKFGYQLELNGVKYQDGDTVNCSTNQNFRVALLENGIAISANFSFGAGVPDASGYQAFVTYDKNGTYTLKAEKGAIVIKVYIMVGTLPTYSLKINNNLVENNSTYKAVAGVKLGFKVVDNVGKAINANFDFGNGYKITTDSVSASYKKGTYALKVVIGKTIIKVNMVVSEKENSGEAIILISSSVSNNNIDAVFGLRCDAINSVNLNKDVYVAGELPGVNWRDYSIGHPVVYVDDVAYFKWEITAIAGNYRMSWIQLKAGLTEFKYDNCSWAYYPSSKYWNTEGLFRFTTYIENGIAKIKP